MTNKEINEHILKISGKATLLEPLDLSKSFKLEVDGAVTETTDIDNDDGTFARAYKFKPTLVRVLKDNGEVTRTKDLRSRSKQMRATIRYEWQKTETDLTEQEYYDQRMAGLIEKIIEGSI